MTTGIAMNKPRGKFLETFERAQSRSVREEAVLL